MISGAYNYFTLFAQTMKNHQGTGGNEPDQKQNDHQRSLIERFYFAQCVKDETMAESIAGLLNPQSSASERSLIIHFNGSFHSDYRLGAAARASRRLLKRSRNTRNWAKAAKTFCIFAAFAQFRVFRDLFGIKFSGLIPYH